MPLEINTNVQDMDDVRRALAKIVAYVDDLESTSDDKGAEKIGFHDPGNRYTATDVAAALEEVGAAAGL